MTDFALGAIINVRPKLSPRPQWLEMKWLGVLRGFGVRPRFIENAIGSNKLAEIQDAVRVRRLFDDAVQFAGFGGNRLRPLAITQRNSSSGHFSERVFARFTRS